MGRGHMATPNGSQSVSNICCRIFPHKRKAQTLAPTGNLEKAYLCGGHYWRQHIQQRSRTAPVTWRHGSRSSRQQKPSWWPRLWPSICACPPCARERNPVVVDMLSTGRCPSAFLVTYVIRYMYGTWFQYRAVQVAISRAKVCFAARTCPCCPGRARTNIT